MKLIKTPTKGMNDYLPSEVALREYVKSVIVSSYSSAGFCMIETPAVEHIENLTGKNGGENEKLIFKIMKRGEKLVSAGLRYDLTVPLSRYYANNSAKLPSPFLAMQIGNVWRADRPQKGRYRQFTQCDIDIFGDATNSAEIELITATSTYLLSHLLRVCFVSLALIILPLELTTEEFLSSAQRLAASLPRSTTRCSSSLTRWTR